MTNKLSAVAHSPLDGVAVVTAADYRQQEAAFQTKLILRGHADDTAFADAVKKTLAATLPTAGRTTKTANRETLLWLGPNEWLLWTSAQKQAARLTALQTAFAELHAAVVDVSDYYTIFRLEGGRVPDILAHGCPLDISGLRTGDCTQSRFRNAPILLHQTDNKPSYRLQVRWSFADYLWHYLAELLSDS